MDCYYCRHTFEAKVRKAKKVRKAERPCCSTWKNPIVSKRRLDNFFKTFHNFQWIKNTVEITVVGLGDRPAYQIKGWYHYTKFNFKIKVMWHSFTPGGGQARMYYWLDSSRFIVNAPFIDAKKVEETIKKDFRKTQELSKVFS